MPNLADRFVYSAIGFDGDGQRLLMPFGRVGKSYVIETEETYRRLRKHLRNFFPFLVVIILLMLTLFILPQTLRAKAAPYLLIATGIAAVGFFVSFAFWTRSVTSRLNRLEADKEVIQFPNDKEEHVAWAIATLIREQVGSQSSADLVVIGALAGFSCQLSVRKQDQNDGATSFVLATLADGKRRFFGDRLNQAVAEGTPSLWSMIGQGAPISDLHDLFRHAVESMGNEDPQTVALLSEHMPKCAKLLAHMDIKEERWFIAMARAARQMLSTSPHPIPEGAMIIMQSAIPMSNMDVGELLQYQRAKVDC